MAEARKRASTDAKTEEVKDENLTNKAVAQETENKPADNATEKVTNGEKPETENLNQPDEKDAKIADLEKQLADSKKEVEAKDVVITEQRAEIEKLSDENLNGGSTVETENIATAKVVEKDAKLVKVQFLKDHSFTMGTTDIKALKGQTKEVDTFSANKLSARGIAVLVSK